MIVEIKPLIPHQRANTRDPSINKMIYYRIERGGVIIDALGIEVISFARGSGDMQGIPLK
jgi:hypothetical protein